MLQFGQWAAVIATTTGVVVMAGWITDLAPLTRIVPAFVTMKFNTALWIALDGSALLFRLGSKRAIAGVIALALASAVTRS